MKKLVHNLITAPFCTGIALWGIVALIRAVWFPNQAPTQNILPVVIYYLWAATYGMGGGIMLVGQSIQSSRVLAVGCILFAEGAMVSAMATFWDPPAEGIWSGINSAILGIAALVRCVHLMRGETLQWIGQHRSVILKE